MIRKQRELSRSLEEAQCEVEHIRRIANALVKTATLKETCELVVKECKAALSADAICLLLIENDDDDEFVMVAEIGCSDEFKRQWKRVAKTRLPLVNLLSPYKTVFIGSSEEIKREVSNIEKLVDQSKRKVIAYAPMVVNGNSIGIIGFSYNTKAPTHSDKNFITTVVSLCAQGLERARLFEHERVARKDAEEANRAKTNFLTSMSHEIRTPIGVIKGFADLIYKSSSLPATEKKWALRILKNSEHLVSLIGDILDISKIEAKKVEVNKCLFSLAEFIDDIKSIISLKAEEKSIRLLFLCNDPHTNLYSEPIHLRQIVINLIGNAIKFTPRLGEIQVRFELDESLLRISVKDNGVGIPAEHHVRIFEPFNQVVTSLRDRPPGTGLGLSISKYLAEAIGGNLALTESQVDQGSTFTVEVSCTGEPQIESKIHTAEKGEPKLKGAKILVVDDSEDNQELLKFVLSSQGGQVDIASNGLIGVQKAMSSDYNLIVMDIQMPEMDGNQAVAELRSRGFTKPIIALTAEVVNGVKEKLLNLGFDEYLSKPIDLDFFIQTLARFV